MIVQSMTSKELVSEILSDYEVVQRKIAYLIKSLRREVVKSRSKHVYRVFDYKTNRYNKWKILLDYPYKKPKHIALVYYRDDFGLQHGIKVDRGLQSLTHYTPHFISRYNKRYAGIKSISDIDLLVHFLEDNFVDAIDYTETPDTNRREITCKIRDGVGFGNSEYIPEIGKELLHFRTFITDEMLFQDQVDDAHRMRTGIQRYILEHKIEFQKRA